MTHHEFVLPTRKAHRLPNYDYSHTGAYFVTICTRGRWCLFGDVRDEEMHLNRYGSIVADEWFRTAQLRRNVEFGAFVVMPNHVQGDHVEHVGQPVCKRLWRNLRRYERREGVRVSVEHNRGGSSRVQGRYDAAN